MREGRENGGVKGGRVGAARDRSRSRSPRRGGADRRDERGDKYADERMVYISNIPYELRWMELKDLLREKGGEVRFVEILEDRNGKSKGCAVAEFVTRDGASKAMEGLHRYEVHGRMLLVKKIRDPQNFFAKVREETGIDFLRGGGRGGGGGGGGGPRADRPVRSERRDRVNDNYDTYGLSMEFLRSLSIEPPLSPRVFIANLSYTANPGKIYDVFSLAGKITWLDLQLDKDGKSKGIAIVQYSHPIEAVQAVSMLNGQRLFDRQLAVKIDRFDRDDMPQEGELPRGLASVGMGLGANGAPLTDVLSVLTPPSNPTPAPPVQPFVSPPVAAPVQSYSSAPVFPPAPSYPQQPATQAFAPSHQTFPQVPAYPTFHEDTKYNVSRVLLIKNLPPDYSWKIVHDRVSQLGDLEGVDMVSPGCARVRFVMLSDAERARASLQGSTVEGRPIHVEYL